jgi:hypothetical protein
MQFVRQIGMGATNSEQVTKLDVAMAHTYDKGLFEIKYPNAFNWPKKLSKN